MTAIRTEGLTKMYGETIAVDELNITVPDGTVYGFLGPNGAGKTTTMRMLTTLVTPSSGAAYICGEPISNRDKVTRHIGYLPEEPPIREYLTGYEQLEYVSTVRGISSDITEERKDELLRRFELHDAANQRISEYSKGMRQKIGLIQAILHDPDVLLLDEPTSGLDPQAAQTMKETISDLAERDITVFLSSHILPVVDELADMVGVLHEGSFIGEDTPTGLKSRTKTGSLEDAFLHVTTNEGETNAAGID